MEGSADHFGDLGGDHPPQNSAEKTAELTTKLLLAMGKSLGYDFDEVQIKKGAYYPMGLGNVEEEQHALRRGLLELLAGKRRMPVGVLEEKFPQFTFGQKRRCVRITATQTCAGITRVNHGPL